MSCNTQGPVSLQNLESTSDLKHGQYNDVMGEFKSVSKLKILPETGAQTYNTNHGPLDGFFRQVDTVDLVPVAV